MPTRKQPPSPPWLMILEEIRSQGRLTREAIEASREALEKRFDRLDETLDRMIAGLPDSERLAE